MGRSRPWPAAVAAALAFVPLAYDPRPLVPSEEDRKAGELLVAKIADLKPPVFLPDHGYLLTRAFGPDAQPSVHGMVINDLLKSGLDDEAGAFVAALEEALAGGRYSAVILDETWPDLRALRDHYAAPVPLWKPNDDAFTPVTGSPKRPTWLYRRAR